MQNFTYDLFGISQICILETECNHYPKKIMSILFWKLVFVNVPYFIYQWKWWNHGVVKNSLPSFPNQKKRNGEGIGVNPRTTHCVCCQERQLPKLMDPQRPLKWKILMLVFRKHIWRYASVRAVVFKASYALEFLWKI